MPRTATRPDRISLRVSPRAKRTLERAATYLDKTLTDFITDVAFERAEAVVREQEAITLTTEEWERFRDLLLNPPAPNEELKKALTEATGSSSVTIDDRSLNLGPLGSNHDRRSFSCGHASLDRYVREQAGQDVRRGLTRVFVATTAEDPNRILGFFTLSATSVSLANLLRTSPKGSRLIRYQRL